VIKDAPKLVTTADLQDLPWSRHHRYELLDGRLITHEQGARSAATTRFLWFLAEMGSAGRITAPWMGGLWHVDDHNAYKPDALYPGYRVETDERGNLRQCFVWPPVLAVDVLEPPCHEPEPWRLKAYARAGLQWYWVADGEVPSVAVYMLVEDMFVQTAVVEGDDVMTVREPFSLKLHPRGQLT
jgi:hypothetical protein